MPYADKKHRWRDPEVARTYNERRFRTRLGRLKHGLDARLILGLLERAGEVKTVLDLPSGTGRLLPELVAAGYRAVGADLSSAMLEQGRATSEVLQADGEHLPFADGAFDAVVSLRFLFHVDAEGPRRRILTEMARVARRCVIGEVRFGGNVKHASRRLLRPSKVRPTARHGELERELAAAGLTLDELRPVSRLFSDKALFRASRTTEVSTR